MFDEANNLARNGASTFPRPPALLPYRDGRSDHVPFQRRHLRRFLISVFACFCFALVGLVLALSCFSHRPGGGFGFHVPDFLDALPYLALCLAGLLVSSLVALRYLRWMLRGRLATLGVE